MASTYLQRTPSGGNRKKWTWSAWIKFSAVPSGSTYLWSGYSGSNNTGYLSAYFDSNQKLSIGAWTVVFFNTTRAFRDVNAWYHIVIVMDTAQATASNRLKLYVNGLEETAFDSDNRSSISQDSDMGYNSNGIHTIGGYQSSGSANAGFDGTMSHVHFTDGYAYTPSDFGETDSTTGEWKINTAPSVSYGTTGYWIFKDDAGITDQSPNSNNWTATGTLTPTKDCPSNNFATLNALAIFQGNSGPVLENGNTTLNTTAANSNKALYLSSLGMTSGKFYCEIKIPTVERFSAGVCNKNVFLSSSAPDSQTNQAAITYYYDGSIYYDNNQTVSGGVSLSNNDILGIALDMDNNRLFFHKNGTYINSGDPTSSTGNVASFTNASQYLTDHEEMFFFVADLSTSGKAKSQVNFGNGYFGTTQITSAGTNASNIGIFEYDVPTGYTALCTKGLNE